LWGKYQGLLCPSQNQIVSLPCFVPSPLNFRRDDIALIFLGSQVIRDWCYGLLTRVIIFRYDSIMVVDYELRGG